MTNFSLKYRDFTYHVLNINLIALGNIVIDAWPGAMIRNNLLYAARQIEYENGDNFYSVINNLPLPEVHPLHKEMQGGFPRGFVIFPLSHTDMTPHPIRVKKHEHFSFSLVLIGNFARYCHAFIEAIRLMCERGFGKPIHPFQLLEIEEVRRNEKPVSVFSPACPDIAPLKKPFSLNMFTQNDYLSYSYLGIRYSIPTLLYTPRNKKDRTTSFQDKMNGFPSFYQLVRSVCYRLIKLYALYIAPDDTEGYLELQHGMEDYLNEASRAILLEANLKMTVMRSTLKKENTERIQLPGYVGELIFEGDFEKYLGLLLFARNLGVGKDTSYGLGKFEIFESTTG